MHAHHEIADESAKFAMFLAERQRLSTLEDEHARS